MTTRYRLLCRDIRGGRFDCVDKTTGKRTSLKTTSRDEAQQIVDANRQRWQTAAKDRALAPLLPRVIVETPADLLLLLMKAGMQPIIVRPVTHSN